jgi:hypothetical protein
LLQALLGQEYAIAAKWLELLKEIAPGSRSQYGRQRRR